MIEFVQFRMAGGGKVECVFLVIRCFFIVRSIDDIFYIDWGVVFVFVNEGSVVQVKVVVVVFYIRSKEEDMFVIQFFWCGVFGNVVVVYIFQFQCV